MLRKLTSPPRLAAWWLLQGFLERSPVPLLRVGTFFFAFFLFFSLLRVSETKNFSFSAECGNIFLCFFILLFAESGTKIFFLSPSSLLRMKTKLFLFWFSFDSFFFSSPRQGCKQGGGGPWWKAGGRLSRPSRPCLHHQQGHLLAQGEFISCLSILLILASIISINVLILVNFCRIKSNTSLLSEIPSLIICLLGIHHGISQFA